MSDTPETDAAKINISADCGGYYMETQDGSHYEDDLVSAAAAKSLERQRNAYAETIREFLAIADDFAESRRGQTRFLALADKIDERHPELVKEATESP